jgi:hypothetical protein
MLEEVEKHFYRMAAHFTDTAEREQFLVRTLSAGALTVLHDQTWQTIFRSQCDLLQELNTKPAMNLDQVKPFYDAAVAAHPEAYKERSFELWLSYMRGQNVILQDANVIQITIRGKDFLRYIVQEGRSVKPLAF